MFRKFLISVFITLGVVQAAGAALKVGVSGDYPPLIYKQEGRLVGIEADNVKAVGDILGQQMTMVDMPFAQLIPALKAGEIDVIMSGMSITAERSEQVLFAEPYMEIGQMAIMSTEKVGQFSKPWSIYGDGVRIGVEPGTTGAAFAEEKLTGAVITMYPDSDAAFAGLRKDEIDLYIHDAPTSWQLATASENSDLISLYQPLTNEALAWAVRKDDQVLAESLNQALRTLKGNGALRYILNRWIPVTVEVR
jgi:polar amino acid transport system substrate-binding protein